MEYNLNIEEYAKLTPLRFEEFKIIFENKLNQIDLDKMKYFKRVELLIKLLNECQKYTANKHLVETILQRWCNHDIDIDGVIGDLAAVSMCKINLLKYLVNMFSDSTIVTILDTHIRTRYGSGIVFSFVCDRLMEAYEIDNLSEYEWRALIEASIDSNHSNHFDIKYLDRQSNYITKDNQDVLDYIESKLREVDVKIPAKIPTYISILENENENVYLNYIKEHSFTDQRLTLKELQETKDTFFQLVNKQKVIENDLGDVAPLMMEEAIEVFNSLKDNIQNFAIQNEETPKTTEEIRKRFPIERYYGPSNAIAGTNCLGAPDGVGPCRMFYCTCRDFDIEDEIEYDDNVSSNEIWFTGNCDQCSKKIKKFRHAIRFPVNGGGWHGCYCSFECLNKSEVYPIYSDDLLRITEIKNIINTTGIFDL